MTAPEPQKSPSAPSTIKESTVTEQTTHACLDPRGQQRPPGFCAACGDGPSEVVCHICQRPSVVTRKGANRDYGLCVFHVERAALNAAWEVVDQALRPLGHYGWASNSPWNQGYEQAKNEALNAILALRTTLDAKEKADG